MIIDYEIVKQQNNMKGCSTMRSFQPIDCIW